MVRGVRTALNLSAEALVHVRQLAQQRRKTLGAIASELILEALEPAKAATVRNGVPIFAPPADSASEGPAPDVELVNRLRDEAP